ncbi:MAG: hypothetical protein LBR09_02960 [Endomicrobium sp.]|jgi:hypothetical protein|nr:hypothetical protein [Endomicrobium sp.]
MKENELLDFGENTDCSNAGIVILNSGIVLGIYRYRRKTNDVKEKGMKRSVVALVLSLLVFCSGQLIIAEKYL